MLEEADVYGIYSIFESRQYFVCKGRIDERQRKSFGFFLSDFLRNFKDKYKIMWYDNTTTLHVRFA